MMVVITSAANPQSREQPASEEKRLYQAGVDSLKHEDKQIASNINKIEKTATENSEWYILSH